MFIISLRDVTDRKARLDQLEEQALHDGLTGLPNRLLFGDRLEHAMASARRTGEPLSLMMLDLNGFKQVNDELGHEVGDRVLQLVGSRLSGALRESDTVARLGGDEFVVLPVRVRDRNTAEVLAQKILRSLGRPTLVSGHAIEPTASIGIAMYPADGVDSLTLMRSADQAMYSAKRAGSGLEFASSLEIVPSAQAS